MESVTIAFMLFSPQYGDIALHKASRSESGHPEVVKLLLQSHADVNAKDKVSIILNHLTSTIHSL